MNVRFLYILFFVFLLCCPVFAEETNKSEWGENTDVFTKGFENQKAITDTKAKKIIEQLKERSLSKKQKKIRDEVNPLSPSSDYEHLKNFTQSQDPDNDLSQTLTVMIPVQAYNDEGKYVSPGYYKLACHKVAENEYVLELSQGTRRIMSVPAKQTNQDLEQETITFCNAEIIDDSKIRLMYGSIDLNLVGYLYFK